MVKNLNPISKTATPRWVRVLLGGSLALNLLVLGLVGGAMVRYGGLDGMRTPPRTFRSAMFRELSREDRRALRDRSNGMMMMSGMNMDHHARQMDEAREVSVAMQAEPFNRDVLSAILDQQVAQRGGFQKSIQQAWLERVTNMSKADRYAYARRLEHAMNRAEFRNRRVNQHD